MAECTQQQQHPITRQTGWPAGTPVHHLCVYVCVNDTHIHTITHRLVVEMVWSPPVPPVITQEVIEGNRVRERDMRREEEEGRGKMEWGKNGGGGRRKKEER